MLIHCRKKSHWACQGAGVCIISHPEFSSREDKRAACHLHNGQKIKGKKKLPREFINEFSHSRGPSKWVTFSKVEIHFLGILE